MVSAVSIFRKITLMCYHGYQYLKKSVVIKWFWKPHSCSQGNLFRTRKKDCISETHIAIDMFHTWCVWTTIVTSEQKYKEMIENGKCSIFLLLMSYTRLAVNKGNCLSPEANDRIVFNGDTCTYLGWCGEGHVQDLLRWAICHVSIETKFKVYR